MPQSFGSLHCHIVFSTKNREKRIGRDCRPRLFEYMGGTLRNQSSRLIAAGGTSDHVHLLVSLGRSVTVADVVRVVKANSSRWMHDEMKLGGFAWQSGYGAFAVSYSNLNQVKEYLARQEEHHRQKSFEEEFLELLRRHNLQWDERYVWD